MNLVIKKPTAKQDLFLRSRARHTAYGGARGGGKSEAMRILDKLLAVNYTGLNILLMRRTLPELEENHANKLLADLAGVAKYNTQKHVFTFPTGSRIKLGYCAREKDVFQYQGQEYDVIGLEEATHFTESQMQFITTCNRNTRTDFSPRMYYTCNPGGVGHAWVKRLFIDRQYQNAEKAEDYLFIQATIYDNPALLNNDPGYVTYLMNLPEDLRRAHMDGDWDVLSGQYFSEFTRIERNKEIGVGNMIKVRPHVISPFPIPEHWVRVRGIDYGLDCAAALWLAFNEMGQGFVYNEFDAPNLIISDFCARMIDRTQQSVECTYAPRDLMARSTDTGISAWEQFYNNGVPLTLGAIGRVDGWLNMKEWLKPVPDLIAGGLTPNLRVFDTCKKLISDLPSLQHDEKNVNDVATEPHNITHLPDALRTVLDGRPRKPQSPTQETLYQSYEDQVDDFVDYGR